MKKNVLALCLSMLLISASGETILNSIYLTGFTIQKNTDVIGEVKVHDGSPEGVKVTGRDAAYFRIDDKYVLRVAGNKLPKARTRFEIVLHVQAGGSELSESFVILRDGFIKNKVVAHRGAWKNTNVPENSIAAFRHAVRLGCEGSEFDVHMSSDSIPVVNHDATIQGVSIAKTPLSGLLLIKLPNGEPIPTLESYLKAGMEQEKTRLVLEIKSSELGKDASIALTRKVVALVAKLHAQAWTDYIAFDYDVCKEVMRLAPYARVAYLNGDKAPQELSDNGFFGLDYNLRVFDKNPSWIAEAQQKNLTVNVWTVNDAGDMRRLLDQKVDYITTNEPERLLELIKR